MPARIDSPRRPFQQGYERRGRVCPPVGQICSRAGQEPLRRGSPGTWDRRTADGGTPSRGIAVRQRPRGAAGLPYRPAVRPAPPSRTGTVFSADAVRRQRPTAHPHRHRRHSAADSTGQPRAAALFPPGRGVEARSPAPEDRSPPAVLSFMGQTSPSADPGGPVEPSGWARGRCADPEAAHACGFRPDGRPPAPAAQKSGGAKTGEA